MYSTLSPQKFVNAIVKNRPDICFERYQGSSIKLIIERGATVDVESTSNHYRRLASLQGELEIKCKVTVKLPNASPRQVTEPYGTIFEVLCST